MTSLTATIGYAGKLTVASCENIVMKCVAALIFLAGEYLFDGVMSDALFGLLFLIIVDFGTALMATKKTGEKITSHNIFRTPIKIALYFVVIACGRVSEYALPSFIGMVDDVIVAFLVATELQSIMENMIKMGYQMPIGLITRLKSFIRSK